MTLRAREIGGLLSLAAGGALAWAVLSGATDPIGAAGSPRILPRDGSSPAVSTGQGSGELDGGTPVSGTAVTGDPANGRNLYLQSCASCHGQQGEGIGASPSLKGVGTALVDFVLRTGRMPLAAPTEPSRRKPPAFGAQAIADLGAYVGTFGPGPSIPSVSIAGADLSLGRDLFISNCASCHGATGAGGAVGGGFVAPPLDRADPLTVGEAVVAGPGPMPPFAFSGTELDALAAYVAALQHPESPGGLAVAEVGPVAEGFLAGTIGIVTLLVVARWIAREETPANAAVEADGSDETVDGAAGGGRSPAEGSPGVADRPLDGGGRDG